MDSAHQVLWGHLKTVGQPLGLDDSAWQGRTCQGSLSLPQPLPPSLHHTFQDVCDAGHGKSGQPAQCLLKVIQPEAETLAFAPPDFLLYEGFNC